MQKKKSNPQRSQQQESVEEEKKLQDESLARSLKMAHEVLGTSKAIEEKLYEQGKSINSIDRDCDNIKKNAKKGNWLIDGVKSFLGIKFLFSKPPPPEPLDPAGAIDSPLPSHQPSGPAATADTVPASLQSLPEDRKLDELGNVVCDGG